MKNILFILLAGFMVFFTSCSEKELEITNPNAPTTQVFWENPDDAEKGINAVYNQFYKPGSWSRWIFFRYDLTSDEGWSQSPWPELKEWTRFQYFNYNFWEGNGWIWEDHYQAVFRANQVIANVPDIEFDDAAHKQDIIGQAKFLRAFYYFNLAVMFGDIPMVLEPSRPQDRPEQVDVSQVWEQVKQDLSDAAAVLPPTREDSELGRPTKGAALALLGKAHMQTYDWPAAKSAFEWLVEGEGAQYYGLMDNYKDNFKHTTENNRESVFEIQFTDANKGPDGDYTPNPNLGSNRAQFFAPRGIGWSDGQPRMWLVDEYKKEPNQDGEIDPRLRASLFYPDLQTDYPEEDIYGRNWEWGNEAFFRKYQGDYYRDFEDYYSPINFRVIRYADVLLSYAEVLANMGGGAPPALAVEMVNRVRTRPSVNLPTLQNSSLYSDVVNSKEDFLKRLQMERALELCLEGVRWIDLKRWKLWETQEGLNELISRDPDFNNFDVGKNNVMPIPQSEVDNNPNLEQNPNY